MARMTEAHSGEGWAATSIDDLGDGPGFRKIRPAIDVTAFGMNAIVLPPGVETGRHFHERQEEAYFLHLARVDAPTVRMVRNVGDEDAVYVVVGGAGGYVGRDGHVPEGEPQRARQTS